MRLRAGVPNVRRVKTEPETDCQPDEDTNNEPRCCFHSFWCSLCYWRFAVLPPNDKSSASPGQWCGPRMRNCQRDSALDHRILSRVLASLHRHKCQVAPVIPSATRRLSVPGSGTTVKPSSEKTTP